MSNINKSILNLLDEIEISSNEKEFMIEALELEFAHSDKKKPRLSENYKEFIEKYSGNYED